MVRRAPRPRPQSTRVLNTLIKRCPACQGSFWVSYHNKRTIHTLDGLLGLTLKIRRCVNDACERFHLPYRPEEELRLTLPEHQFGLDVITLIGALRHAEHRSIPEIHAELLSRGVEIAERTVTNLLDRYEELLAISLNDDQRLKEITSSNGRVILAIDGLAPEVGNEVLWVFRDCLSGEVLLAKALLSSSGEDLALLLKKIAKALTVPIVAFLSDGQRSIRAAVRDAFPGTPHQLCHFHYLREAAKPVYEADRHAKKELKKRVRGVRPIERKLEKRGDKKAEIARAYCAAVRSALTDDGRPPLESKGLVLHDRLSKIKASLDRVEKKGD